MTALCGREAERKRGWESAAVILSGAKDLMKQVPHRRSGSE
jgi:hypothetical protein